MFIDFPIFTIVSQGFACFFDIFTMISTWNAALSTSVGTALHTAADTNNAAVAQVLLDAGTINPQTAGI